jgi:transcriptional regulator with XRE-family HTH domain
MAQVGLLVHELKRALKAQGMTYAEVARRVGLSESSIKRMLAKHTLSLRRLEQICHAAGLEISDLVDLLAARREYLTELTPEQEEALLADPKLLLTTYLLINGWPLQAITQNFQIEDDELDRLLVRLHKAKLIELLPLRRFRLLTARNFAWRPNGPVQKFLTEQVHREFLESQFSAEGETFRFVGGMLSRTGLAQMQLSMERLAREFDELARRDAVLPLSERHACGAVLAIRPWEFSVFKGLRRRGR